MLDLRGRRKLVEGTAVAQTDQLLPANALREVGLRIERHRNPFAPIAQAVLRVRLDRGGDVRGQRPRRGRPHDERLTLPVEQRKAHVEGRVELLTVDVRL